MLGIKRIQHSHNISCSYEGTDRFEHSYILNERDYLVLNISIVQR